MIPPRAPGSVREGGGGFPGVEINLQGFLLGPPGVDFDHAQSAYNFSGERNTHTHTHTLYCDCIFLDTWPGGLREAIK